MGRSVSLKGGKALKRVGGGSKHGGGMKRNLEKWEKLNMHVDLYWAFMQLPSQLTVIFPFLATFHPLSQLPTPPFISK